MRKTRHKKWLATMALVIIFATAACSIFTGGTDAVVDRTGRRPSQPEMTTLGQHTYTEPESWQGKTEQPQETPAPTPAPPEMPEEALDTTITPTLIDAPEPCPITEEEIIMLAKTMYEESQVVYWDGSKWGVSYKARQAAVAWTAFNRLDDGTWGDTLADVLSYPGAFAYSPSNGMTPEMLELARDVADRWWAEKLGEISPGRTLPADYLYFHGDGRENYFRQNYEHTGGYWDWSLPDPYAEG